jgi:hypothetical protein
MGTLVSGEGFDYPDGTAVTATVGPDASETATTSLEDGTFDFDFPAPLAACGLPTLSVALYIDVDGDGSCQLAADDVFVRAVRPGTTAGSYAALSVSQDSERCPALFAAAAPNVVAAARRLCPEIGVCLPFCSEPEPTRPDPAGDGFGGFCSEPTDGGLDGGDADVPDAPGADASDAAIDGG